MYNFGVLRQLWKTAYDAVCLSHNFGSEPMAAGNSSQDIPIPNLNSDVVALTLAGHIIVSSVAGRAQVAGSLAIDIMDNIIIKDPEGKTVIDIGWESTFNYCGMWNGGNVGDIDALGVIAPLGTNIYDFRIVLPVYIPASQGIHTLKFDWDLTNIYGGDVVLNAGSLVALNVATNDGANLEKWKAVDRTQGLLNGNNQVANFETGRNWYAVMIQNLATGVPDIDDVKLAHQNNNLIDEEYDELESEFLARTDEIDFAPRFAGDVGLYFRNHAHLSTDNFIIEGTATAVSMVLLLIASADASRTATTPEVTGGSTVAQVATTPAVTMGQQSSTVIQGNQTTAGNRILPVKLNVGY